MSDLGYVNLADASDEQLLNRGEVAAALGVVPSSKMDENILAAGIKPAQKVGRIKFFRAGDIKRLKAERERKRPGLPGMSDTFDRLEKRVAFLEEALDSLLVGLGESKQGRPAA